MVIALDVGTSSARAARYDDEGRPAPVPVPVHRVAYEPVTTPDGGVEHDPARLLDAVATCLDRVHAASSTGDASGVGLATFWHGLLGFDGAGEAVTPVYMWADTRSASDADALRSELDDAALHARTGCHLHASYWPAKLRWLARARPAEFRRVARWGSFGEYLETRLFGEAATSLSIASATGLLDQAAAAWDAAALAASGLDERRLFPVVDRTEPRRGLREPWAGRWPALARVPWFPAVGDGAAGNVGSGCVDPTRVALNVGTSAAMRIVTLAPPAPPPGLWRYRLDRRRSLVGGATSEGGNVYAWWKRLLRLPDDEGVEAELGRMAADAHGLTMLPFLAGERSPGWRADRRAAVVGLSLGTTAMDLLRAALESVALRLARVYALLAPCAAAEHAIVASGGALAGSRLWTQTIADALGRTVVRSPSPEATSRGVALLTLEALGRLPELPTGAETVEAFVPDPARHARYRAAAERQRRLEDRV